MPPVNRKTSASPVKRRPAIAGTRTAGTGHDTETTPSGPTDLTKPSPKPRADDTAAAGGAVVEDLTAPATTQRPRRLLAVSLTLAALMLIAAVVLATVSWVHARGPGDTAGAKSNVALINAPETQQVGAAAVAVLQKAYSYSYTTIDADFNAAIALMTPGMAGQYRPLLDNIRTAATQAKTTTKATVVSDAVRLLDGDRAEVIAFVVVTGDNAGTALQPSGYRFTASMLRDNGKWLLSGLTES